MSKAFAGLSQHMLVEILPNKEDVTVTKLCSHAGDNVIVYCVNKQPLLFEIDKEKVLYPTVYLLWRYPDLIARFTTWSPVLKKLADGADLMLPGLVVRDTLTPNTFQHIEKGQTCSINIVGNKAPMVLGYTLLSGSDFFDSGMKGKGIRPLHMYLDELWSFGDKSSPPNLGDEPLSEEYLDCIECDTAPSGEIRVDNDPVIEGAGVGATLEDSEQQQCEECIPEMEAGIDNLAIAHDTEDDTGNNAMHGEEDKESNMTQEMMDEVLQFCFLCAIKNSVKTVDLPLVTSSLYKSHMMKFCPPRCTIDVKKSSFKKLSKFLQHQQETGIIQMKQLTKGVDSLTEIDRRHHLLQGLEVPEVSHHDTNVAAEGGVGKVSPPQITELYAINTNTMALFQGLGYKKGDSLTSQDVRKCITEYIKSNNLQAEDAKNQVVLDPFLAEVVLNKSEGDRSTLTWDAVFSRLLNKMSPVYEISLSGQEPYIRKGKIESITLDVTQKASNKKVNILSKFKHDVTFTVKTVKLFTKDKARKLAKTGHLMIKNFTWSIVQVTVVENLTSFGIDPKQFGHVVQVKLACSASVSPSLQKTKGPVVLVQGNQITFIAELLTNTYQIPKKYIKGLEKAPKLKRK